MLRCKFAKASLRGEGGGEGQFPPIIGTPDGLPAESARMIALSGNHILAAAKLLRGAAAPQRRGAARHRGRARSQALELIEREGLLNAAWRWSIVPLDDSPKRDFARRRRSVPCALAPAQDQAS